VSVCVCVCVKQRCDERHSTCYLLPLFAWHQNTSVTDVVALLLSLAHFKGSEWQSALLYLHQVQSTELHPFSSYLEGNVFVFVSF